MLEQGSYSDYGVSLVDVTDCPLTEDEVMIIMKIDAWDKPILSARIEGEIVFTEQSSIGIQDLDECAKANINGLFSCYLGRKHTTVLDRQYSKEELLKIAQENDTSGIDFWNRVIDERYNTYIKAYPIYQKMAGVLPETTN